MKTDIETKYCQSCGMPLDIEDITEYGTNSDGTLNNTSFTFGDFSPILIIKLLVRITKARN